MCKTSLQLSGASEKNINWQETNLLLIDMQKQYQYSEVNLAKEGDRTVKKRLND